MSAAGTTAAAPVKDSCCTPLADLFMLPHKARLCQELQHLHGHLKQLFWLCNSWLCQPQPETTSKRTPVGRGRFGNPQRVGGGTAGALSSKPIVRCSTSCPRAPGSRVSLSMLAKSLTRCPINCEASLRQEV